MHRKIRYDGQSKIFGKFFWELNKAKIQGYARDRSINAHEAMEHTPTSTGQPTGCVMVFSLVPICNTQNLISD